MFSEVHFMLSASGIETVFRQVKLICKVAQIYVITETSVFSFCLQVKFCRLKVLSHGIFYYVLVFKPNQYFFIQH
jgi:hypothetical protein